MASAAQRVATFEELYAAIAALPEGITGEVLMDGQIETMARPGNAHARFAARLHRRLLDVEDDPAAGWVFGAEREVRIALNRLVVPDLSGWRIDDGDVGFLDENPILRTPDWACEVLSDSTRRRDREHKLPLFLSAGVAHVWLADPEERRVEVFMLVNGVPVCVAVATGSEIVRLPPFESYPVDLSVLWVPERKG